MSRKLLKCQSEELTSILPRLMRQLFLLYPDDPALELPGAQMRVCSLLLDGPQSMSALSKELGVSLSAMTQIADRLEKVQMVERVTETDDRRVKMLRLNGHGMDIMHSRRARRVERVSQVLEHLEPESRAAVMTAIKVLLNTASTTDIQSSKEIPIIETLIG